jgi:glycosyltransferase involved in cell wall biosynthesis
LTHSSRLRVLLAIESSGPGGAENVVVRLAEALRRAGEDPIVATLRPGWMTERAEAAGLPVWIVPQRPGLDLAWVASFARRLRREQIDVLHSHEFTMNVFGGTAALLAGVRALSTIHGRSWVVERPRRVLAYRVLRRLGIPIVAVSEDLGGFLARGLSISRAGLGIVHNGIPLPPLVPTAERAARRIEARAAIGVPAEGPLVVAVGNLYPVKDHATLVRALADIPRARVAIAGRGEEEGRLRALASELGLAERLHLLGLRDDVHNVLAAGDVFVQSSLSEGLPLAVLEAMAASLPVVATNVGGIGEAVKDRETGYLVPAGDPVQLAGALAHVLESPDRGAALGAAGRRRVEAEFSIEVMAERYRALYRSADASQRRSS